MSKNYEIIVDGHPNIYNNMSAGKLNIYFSEPENGVQEETGMMIIIPGFGGNSNSNVYKKMRTYFADCYNLVTIQCDYFGLEFMQSENLDETNESFNDMGPLQAMDIISSVIIVQEILKDNNLVYDSRKIIVYGHSHGAYLAYLANVFAPNLFSLIIDNSSWLIPVYLFSNRLLRTVEETKVFNYRVKEMNDLDLEIYDLKRLHKKLSNNCVIHSFHGDNDNLISLQQKKLFIQPLRKSNLHEITKDKVNDIFKSNTHGLDADFIKMFEFVMTELRPGFKRQKTVNQLHTGSKHQSLVI
ncbi:DUF2920 family protein [Acetobacterium carbinolicum]|uniref:DUF2920 family protein n=1 Tax=Acetobacterium carbinolicum TaxID=52690 RepID=UPI0039C8FAA0